MDFKHLNRKHRITLGVKPADASKAVDEWLSRQAPVDMNLRRAKTQGLVLLIAELVPNDNASGLYWLSWCVKNYNCKVDIKEL